MVSAPAPPRRAVGADRGYGVGERRHADEIMGDQLARRDALQDHGTVAQRELCLRAVMHQVDGERGAEAAEVDPLVSAAIGQRAELL